MYILKDILASAAGIGPNYKMPHQDMRELFRIDGGEYKPTFCSTLELYHTFPFLDYGSTKEGDELSAVLCNQEGTPGSSNFDQWYNASYPDGKKKRTSREGSKAYTENSQPQTTRNGNGPQILYDYYENGTWPGPRLAVVIVDELGVSQQYGTDLSNVKYGFKAKLGNWDADAGEYQDLELTHLYINGEYVPMSGKVMEAGNDYASRLVKMMFQDDGQEYAPEKALEETLEKFGKDVFQVSAWQAHRQKATTIEHRL